MARTTKIQNLLARFADWSADHGFLGTLLALVYGAVAISFSAAAANETLKAIGWSGNESEREDFSIWVMAVVAAVVVLIIGFILQSYWWPFLISAPLLLVAFLTLGPYGSSMEEAFIGWMPLFFTIAGLGTAIFGGAGVIVGQRLYSSARFEAKARVWTVRLLAGVIGLMIFNVAATVVAHQFEQQDSQSNLRVQICGETVYGIAPIGDQLYLGSGDGIIAFDRVSLAVRWQFRTGGESVMSAPTVTNDRIFFGSHDGYVYSLDLSGNLIWRYYIGNWVFRSPVIADEMVYVGSAAKFVALDAATGTKQWELDLGTWVEISWSEVVGGMIYLGTANGELIALDATNGEERWRYQVSSITAIGTSTPESAPISAWIHDPPIVVDGVVYIASADHFIYSIDAATGIERWRFETSQAAYPSPVVVDGTVYATSNDGHIYALDSATGTLIWTEDTLGGIMSRVVVTNRVLYVTFDRVQGRLAAFDATTGQELWTYFYEHAVRYEFNDPILHDGLILTGTECQGMFAIDATTGTLAWHVLGS